MKTVNIEDESLHNFWTTWRITMKFSGNMCLKILKVTKSFTLSLKSTFLEKLQGGPIDPPLPSLFSVKWAKYKASNTKFKLLIFTALAV